MRRIELGEVEQAAQRHVGVVRALVLPQGHLVVDEEGDVVMHVQVQHPVERRHLELVGVGVVGAVQRVVQRERPILTLRRPE